MRRILNQPGKMLLQLSLGVALLIATGPGANLLRAQTVYAGHLSHNALWAGGECSDFAASFPYQAGGRIFGCGLTASFRWAYHWDVTGDSRWLSANGYAGTSERTLLIGPRYIIHRFSWVEPYGKFLVGEGTIHYPYSIGTDNYFTLAPSGGLNLLVRERLHVHLEYEYQFWLNSPNFTGEANHPLRPNGINVGVTFKAWPLKSQ